MPTGVYPRKKKVLDPDAVDGIDVDAAERIPGEKAYVPPKSHKKKSRGMSEEQASQVLEGILGLTNLIYGAIRGPGPMPEYDPMAKGELAKYIALTSAKYDLPDIPPEYMLAGWTIIGIGIPIYGAEQERKHGGGRPRGISAVIASPAPVTPTARPVTTVIDPEIPLSDYDLAGTARPDGSLHSPPNGAASEVQSAAAGDGLREARVG